MNDINPSNVNHSKGFIMQINIDNLIESWFSNANPQEQLDFFKNLLVKASASSIPNPVAPKTVIAPKTETVIAPKTKPVVKPEKSKMHIQPTVLGKTFKSMKAAAAYYDIPYHTVQYRKDRGQTVEQIYREAYAEARKTKVLRRNEDGSIVVASARNS